MPWEKGQSGNPNGRPRTRVMAEALSLALKREAADSDGKLTRKLNLIADKLVNLALEGDMQAIKEINDRMDGKAFQSVAIGGDDDLPPIHQKIERVIVDPANTDS